jgi:hypothetical protein
MGRPFAPDELMLAYAEAYGDRPKRFRVKIHTGDIVDVSAAQLLSFPRFNQACAEQVGRIFRPPGCIMPEGSRGPISDRWQRVVVDAMERGQ